MATRSTNLEVTRLLTLLAAMSTLFVGTLAIAPAKSQFTEWRAAQNKYGALAQQQNVAPIDVSIQQIWNPRLNIVDRCTSCHVGMGAGEAIAGDRLYMAHPTIPHDAGEIGCTICHGGQGRATKKLAAHGRVEFWDSPMLERPYFEAGCGRCHTHLRVAAPALAERGHSLFKRYDCVACHKVGQEGRGSAPDLSLAGTKGFPENWHARHLSLRASRQEPEWRQSYGDITLDDQKAIGEYLKSLHGAPKLMEAKALAHRLGCRGCHKINGIGGDDGPDLSAVGRKLERDLDFSGIPGTERTLPAWLEAHFMAPDKVVAGSRMPALGISSKDAGILTLYMLSLNPAEVPQEYWPKDRILGVRFKERDFSRDGETLFGVFCAACHGAKGEGRRFANAGVFPAIGSRDFLSIADDEMIRRTITHGRPGRRMPAWGTKDGGLDRAEIDAVVAYLRGLAPATPEPWDQTLPAGVAARGEPVFQKNCSGCHGQRGEGVSAPQLANPAFLEAADDTFIARTVLQGRPGQGMRHFGSASVSFETLTAADVADVVAYIRTLPSKGSDNKE